jgi:hypothetical protein
MTKDILKDKMTAAPFRPFSVRTTDGRQLPVPGPDYAQVSPNGRLLSVWTRNGNSQCVLDVALITELEFQD